MRYLASHTKLLKKRVPSALLFGFSLIFLSTSLCSSVRLALYSTDSDYHSGKFFTTSETGDWNEVGRPTLVVSWGYP